MDRRTFPLAIVALVVWAIWALVLPWINQAVPWNDPVRPGDVIQVTPTVTMTRRSAGRCRAVCEPTRRR